MTLSSDNIYSKTTPEWWAYFAGLFTGEGNIHVSDKFTVRLAIEMCDKAVIQRVGGMLGGRTRKPPLRRANSQIAQPYRWECTDRAIIRTIIHGVLPHMTGSKAEQLRALLEFLDVQRRLSVVRIDEHRRSYTAVELLQLLQYARIVRNFAGGANKGWKRKWTLREQALKREIEYAGMSPCENLYSRATANV